MKLKTWVAAAFAAVVVGSSAAASTVHVASTAYGDEFGRYGGGHSMFLNGARYQFEADGRFTDNGDTATLTGTLTNGAAGYEINLVFNQFAAANQPNPKKELISSAYSENGGPVDTSTWKFWDLVEAGVSTIIGTGTNVGLAFDVISKPVNETYAFQSGIGANGKNVKLGLSGWFFLAGQNTASQNANLCGINSGQTCDINVVIAPVPLPASALLLAGGLFGLGAMRRRTQQA